MDIYLYGVKTGAKWQCVEYARRWLFIRKGGIFKGVTMAVQMWDQLSYVERVINDKLLPLKRYPNGSPKHHRKKAHSSSINGLLTSHWSCRRHC